MSIGKIGDYLARKEAEEIFNAKVEKLTADIESLKGTRFKNIKSAKGVDHATIAVQLLIFHYLGFLNEINLDNTKKALLLAVIFKTDGSENIRKELSNIGGANSKYLTQKNLNFVHDLFEKIDLKEPLKKVKADIKKLSQSLNK